MYPYNHLFLQDGLWQEIRKNNPSNFALKSILMRYSLDLISFLCAVLFISLFFHIHLQIRMCLAVSGISYPNSLGLVSSRLVLMHSALTPLSYPLMRRQYKEAFGWTCRRMANRVCCGVVGDNQGTLGEELELTSD